MADTVKYYVNVVYVAHEGNARNDRETTAGVTFKRVER